MPTTWLTSDLHLFHKNIIVYCGRPHDNEYEMNAAIVSAWNSTVKDDDKVLLIGDLSAGVMGRYEELHCLVKELKGHKVLIRGNHDHQTDEWYKNAGFEFVTDWLLIGDVLCVHKPATSYNVDVIKLTEQIAPRLIIHGHIHDDRPDIPGHFNVAWDRHKKLLNLSDIDTHTRQNV
jgi:calcineurin-like phosphoesterase family protein